jgi:hypothetical protein
MTRRSLSHLRLYSGWLLSTAPFLLANVNLASRMHQLWQLYADILNLFIQLFPFNDTDIQYLLKEDEETLAFSAFTTFVRESRYRVASGGLKSVYNESTFGPRVTTNEMLFRIKAMIKDGAFLLRAVSNSILVQRCTDRPGRIQIPVHSSRIRQQAIRLPWKSW